MTFQTSNHYHSNVVDLEVVLVHREFSGHGDEYAGDDTEQWCRVHVMGERVELVTKLKYLHLRFENGEKDEVAAGAVH